MEERFTDFQVISIYSLTVTLSMIGYLNAVEGTRFECAQVLFSFSFNCLIKGGNDLRVNQFFQHFVTPKSFVFNILLYTTIRQS